MPNRLDNRTRMENYRFYIPDLLTQAATPAGLVRLPEDQAHHARAVLRLTDGTPITVFDGQGGWSQGVLQGETGAKLPKTHIAVHLSGGVHVDPIPPLKLTLATAVPKGERAEWLVEQASQLNVAKL